MKIISRVKLKMYPYIEGLLPLEASHKALIDALEKAMETYLRAILHVQYNCPEIKIADYLSRKRLQYGLCYYFNPCSILSKSLFNDNELPMNRTLFPFTCTARIEHYWDKKEYRNEVVRLLMLRFDYLEKLYFKYCDEDGLQKLSA